MSARTKLGAWSLGLSLVAWGLCAGGGVSLFGSAAPTYSASERVVIVAVVLAAGAFLVSVAALVVAIVGLRRRHAGAGGTGLAVAGLVSSLLAVLGVVTLLVLAFFYAVISYAAVPI